MKSLCTFILTTTCFFLISVYAANKVKIELSKQQSKQIYNIMTGPGVKNEGAAGHLYRTGKSINCRYTNVEITDKKGLTLPPQDPQHYHCNMQIDANGLATPNL